LFKFATQSARSAATTPKSRSDARAQPNVVPAHRELLKIDRAQVKKKEASLIRFARNLEQVKLPSWHDIDFATTTGRGRTTSSSNASWHRPAFA
jgi:hypothetical protein